MMKIFNNQTTDGYSTVFQAQSDINIITCQGNFGTSVIYLQIKPKESEDWSDTGDVFTGENPAGILDKIIKAEFRLDLRNSSAETNINVYITIGDYGFS